MRYQNLFIVATVSPYSQQVSITGPSGEYCKFCGSTNITDFVYLAKASSGINLEPRIDIGGIELPDHTSIVPVSINPGLSYNNNRESGGAYNTKRCRNCNNIDVETSQQPLATQVDVDETAMLPYTLYFLLRKSRYSATDIENLMTSYWQRELRRIRERWMRDGNNPCCRGRQGFSSTLRLKDGKELKIWVIVSVAAENVVYWLSYGGPKTC